MLYGKVGGGKRNCIKVIWNVYSMYFLGFIGARKSEAGLWSTVEWRHFPWMACEWKDKWSVV